METVVGEHSEWRYEKKKSDSSESETYINYISTPLTLENIAIFSIASTLCHDSNIESCLRGMSKRELSPLHSVDTNKLRTNIKSGHVDIHLPNSLKIKVSNVLRPMKLRFFQWVCELKRNNFNDNVIFGKPSLFCWTTGGTIDRVKSLRNIMMSETTRIGHKEPINSVPFANLFKLSCTYCLEEYVPVLWKSLTSEEKGRHTDSVKKYETHLITYWTAIEKNELSTLVRVLIQNDVENIYDESLSVNENMISLCIHVGNAFALRYFWNKLRCENKMTNLEKWLTSGLKAYLNCKNYGPENLQYLSNKEYNLHTDILFYLLSHLTGPNQQKEFLLDNSDVLLRSLINHIPLQRFFLPTISVLLKYLHQDVYNSVMTNIAEETGKGTLTSIFNTAWTISSLDLKKGFIDYLTLRPKTIFCLLYNFDLDTIGMLLSDASKEERRQITFELFRGGQFCWGLAINRWTENFTLIDSLLKETEITYRDILSFKLTVVKEYIQFCILYGDPVSLNEDNKAMENFLTWAFDSQYEIHDFKEIIINPQFEYLGLVILNNYERVEKFLNWYIETEADVFTFQRSLFREISLEEVKFFFLSLARRGKEGWNRFKTFINYNFYSSEDVVLFKKVCERFSNELLTIFVDRKLFEFSTLFLDWCFNSDIFKIDILKNEVISSNTPNLMQNYLPPIAYESVSDWLSLKQDLKWFSLTRESVAKIEHALSEKSFLSYCVSCDNFCVKRCKKRILFHLLNSIVEENEANEDNSNDDLNLSSMLNELCID